LPSSTNADVAYSASDEANINYGGKASSSGRTTPASVSGRMTPTALVVAVSKNSNIKIAKTLGRGELWKVGRWWKPHLTLFICS
jgi:hypothetical protein